LRATRSVALLHLFDRVFAYLGSHFVADETKD
jgi:hypothetical protein